MAIKKAGPAERPVNRQLRIKIKSKGMRGQPLAAPKSQDDFTASGHALAASLGWEGDDKWRIDESGIRVGDAKRYLVKVLHEAHVSAVAPGRAPEPTVDAVALHLGIAEDDTERLQILADALNPIIKAEKQEFGADEGSGTED